MLPDWLVLDEHTGRLSVVESGTDDADVGRYTLTVETSAWFTDPDLDPDNAPLYLGVSGERASSWVGDFRQHHGSALDPRGAHG